MKKLEIHFNIQLIVAALFITTIGFSQVPQFGKDTLLDVACWNLEWFGDLDNGPTNEQLQFNNIKKVLNNTDIDVWGFCEVSSLASYEQLLDDLPQYEGTLATYSATQKTALFYKKDMFELISSNHILSSSQYTYNFAGRPPLEVVLKTKAPLEIDTFYFIVVHLKAMADQSSYDRRKIASEQLKAHHLDQHRSTKKTIVLGDWNDKLNVSTFGGLETPFKTILDDSQNYLFTTKQLNDAGKKSYAFINGSMIDHILINNPMKTNYVSTMTNVLDMMPSYISNFSQNTSDHFPVVSYFTLNNDFTAGLNSNFSQLNSFGVSQNNQTVFAIGEWTGSVELFNLNGMSLGSFEKNSEQTSEFSIQNLPKGMYIAHLKSGQESKTYKFIRY